MTLIKYDCGCSYDVEITLLPTFGPEREQGNPDTEPFPSIYGKELCDKHWKIAALGTVKELESRTVRRMARILENPKKD